ncbi:MAG: O-antigen ligase family protein [Richelia sp. RM2_1_2]|nr:O-antigen ligase family protein [Richelia sp. SM2_1_7]NJM19972.1 O-antigen ligase family protein [Richelia sp. SM1_7_0]NJN13737.1 O-antigen ligase family protein [Richelia sp. RM1_1_1]NJO28886.1 O-antigen ligase family protein [Richelia sp. SL_2_1]NJO62796.1 O-antigen ligase family protein [Richelia sp. RM2_1_2]
MRGEIWTQPKVFAILLICIFNVLILWEERDSLNIPQCWKINRLLWEIFLGIGLISTITSPFPLRSLFAQEQMGDGLLYWLLIAIFTLSNNLLLRLHPEIFRSQLQGLIIGGVILALSIFPQVINWRIDYTATSGQLFKDNILASTIFKNHQPIGLYSHRGHASFVLAACSIITLIGWQKKIISQRNAITALTLIIPALFLTQTRAGIIAFVFGFIYWIYQSDFRNRHRSRIIVCTCLISLLFVGTVSSTRQLAFNNQFNLDKYSGFIKYISSDREMLWERAIRGISMRPLLGWGMNGFGTVYPYIHHGEPVDKVLRLGDFSFDYQDKNGQLKRKQLPTVKAHNLIFDTTLSVGILGLISYFVLIAFCLCMVIKSPLRGIEAVLIVYLAFTFTWFECAQFTHIAWWVLSLSLYERD